MKLAGNLGYHLLRNFLLYTDHTWTTYVSGMVETKNEYKIQVRKPPGHLYTEMENDLRKYILCGSETENWMI